MAKPAKTILEPIVYRDTWGGLTLSFSSDGTAMDSNLSSVRMFFRDADGTTGLELTSADAEITITDANAWAFTVLAVNPLTLAIGNWYWSIETTNALSIVKTYIVGTMEVINDATY